MSSPFYKYPLALSRIFENNELTKCVLGESISQNIQLIITSAHGEHRYNEQFGCKIWDMDFELVMSQRIWEEKLRQSLLAGITEFEKRIEKITIEVQISEVESFQPIRKYVSVKRKVDIIVRGIIVETGEKYNFHTDLYLSPVAQY
jgi:phage baseplate assembly protein W